MKNILNSPEIQQVGDPLPYCWNRPRDLHSLHSPGQFRTALRQERLRADRNNGGFSVVVFSHSGDGRPALLRIGRTILRASRLSDEVGCLSPNQPAALLPDTPLPGAQAFAARICALAAQRGISLSCTAYTYPDENGPDGIRPDREEAKRVWRNTGARASDLTAQASQRETRIGFVNTAHGPFEARPMAGLLGKPIPAWKRAIDVAGSLVGITLSAPIMLAAAVLIRCSSPGPVIFRQRRTGLSGREFTIYKFRTMIPKAEEVKASLRQFSEQDGPAFKMTQDPRVTWVGRFLRITSFDELPQFFNVLKGDMSLVGPRPLPVEESDACRPWHRRRLDVTPGLTCIWQVRGRSRVGFDDWMRMDMEYIRDYSLLTDLKILFLTVPAVLLRRGAH